MKNTRINALSVEAQTPAKAIKQAGLQSLAQVSEITEQSPQTLSNWFYNKRKLFDVVIDGCAKSGLLSGDLEFMAQKYADENCDGNFSMAVRMLVRTALINR